MCTPELGCTGGNNDIDAGAGTDSVSAVRRTVTQGDVDVPVAAYRQQQHPSRHVVVAQDLQPFQRHLMMNVLLIEVEAETSEIPHLS